MANDKKPVRILCLDDEPAPLGAYKSVLEPHGYKVVTTLNSIEALRIMLTEPVDLLIQDLGRPGINGFELYAMLKANERLKNIPVVICSGASTRKFLDRYPNVEGALDKPFDVLHLLDVVRNALRSAEV
jgi:CheY-like chemotaxis protein